MPKHDKDEQRARELRIKLMTEPGQCPVCDEPRDEHFDGADVVDNVTVRVDRSCVSCSISWSAYFRLHDATVDLSAARTT